ncbi:MAG: metallophosphoesterase, partial [Candidatus Hydrogenedentes bacterium]|nr:metallophosphoesterase [Candidatus Hydrogenedentota bacterium]
MIRAFSFFLLVVTIIYGAAAMPGASAENMMAHSLKQLKETPPLSEESLDFIICADPQPAHFLGTPQVFLDMIEEWNILRPDFVVCAGDMIMGGPAIEVGPMWDEFTGRITELDVPFFPVAGNHDVMDEAEVYRIYEDRIAPLYYTFSYGIVQCIILNTEEPGDPDNFSQEQNDWLRSVLAASTAKHIFVFLHVPFFISNWKRDWQPTEEILHNHPVRAVFAGHLHHYRDHGRINGIRYVVAGSAGGGIGIPEEEGGFFCYLAVKVRGEQISWSVMRPGAVLPADTVTAKKVQRLHTLRGMLSGEATTLPWEAPMDGETAVTLTNPFDAPLHTVLHWTTPPGWQVTPQKLIFDTAPGQSVTLTTKMKSTSPARFPVPTLEGTVDNPE